MYIFLSLVLVLFILLQENTATIREMLKNDLKQAIAGAVGVEVSRIEIGQLSAGNEAVVVDVSISPGSKTAKTSTAAGTLLCEELKNENSALRLGPLFDKYMYTQGGVNHSPTRLVVRPGLDDPATVKRASTANTNMQTPASPDNGRAAATVPPVNLVNNNTNMNEIESIVNFGNKQDLYSALVLGMLSVMMIILLFLVKRSCSSDFLAKRVSGISGGSSSNGEPADSSMQQLSMAWRASPMQIRKVNGAVGGDVERNGNGFINPPLNSGVGGVGAAGGANKSIVDEEPAQNVNVFTDEATGKRYSVDRTSGTSSWLEE